MNQLSHIIYYVKNVVETVVFFEKAFGLTRKFVHESGAYAELDTGETQLAFASEEMGKMNFPNFIPPTPSFANEITFTTSDVNKSFDKAIEAGATLVAELKRKPWGQTVGYVRDPNGILIEICSIIDS